MKRATGSRRVREVTAGRSLRSLREQADARELADVRHVLALWMSGRSTSQQVAAAASELGGIGTLWRQLVPRADAPLLFARADAELELARRCGAQVLVPSSDDFPNRLKDARLVPFLVAQGSLATALTPPHSVTVVVGENQPAESYAQAARMVERLTAEGVSVVLSDDALADVIAKSVQDCHRIAVVVPCGIAHVAPDGATATIRERGGTVLSTELPSSAGRRTWRLSTYEVMSRLTGGTLISTSLEINHLKALSAFSPHDHTIFVARRVVAKKPWILDSLPGQRTVIVHQAVDIVDTLAVYAADEPASHVPPVLTI